MNADERYRRDAQAYGPDIAARLRDRMIEPDTAGRLQHDADNLEARYEASGVSSIRGTGRTFDEAARDFLAKHADALEAVEVDLQVPDLCPVCGAYWACDCPREMWGTGVTATPASLLGRPVVLRDDVPPATGRFV